MNYVDKTFIFSAAIRGFHFYRNIWNPKQGEELLCLHEDRNLFDMFAIKTCQRESGETVGHLPREISRPTKFLIDRGAKVTATLTSTKYRKSPLFQGGLEIACIVNVSLPASIKGHLLIEKYKSMVNELYCNPKDEVVIGCFLEEGFNVACEPRRKKKKNVQPNVAETTKKDSIDIRQLFKNIQKKNDERDRMNID